MSTKDPKLEEDDSSTSLEKGNAASSGEKNSSSSKNQKNRLYLKDRCDGTSKYNEGGRPPCFLCWVPKPVYWLSGCLEQNAVCERIGRVGCVDHDDSSVRRKLVSIGLAANVIAFCITIFSCLAISQDFDMLHAASFSRGSTVITNTSTEHSRLDIGLTAVAIEILNPDFANQTKFGRSVVPFDEFCDTLPQGLDRYLDPEECQECGDASSSLVSNIILSLVLSIPTVATDVLRMYPNYDVNCQKFFGTILSALSMLFTLLTYLSYNQSCFATFYDGLVPFFYNETAVESTEDLAEGERIFFVNFNWSAGNGLICMYVATALKVVDIVVMALLPTPSITRDQKEQEEYEVLYGEDEEEVGHARDPDEDTP